ncbi:MAG: hypothetical protein A2Z04_02695 [Chloroflexi bacterium RBG_16_57_9]|nr:MAG: hypothetical protein A2Z04_02695 [Chloroflexi bacterium RBG_16_57_9]
MPYAHIVSWGKYLPAKIVTNADLTRSAGVDADWITSRTGIEQRHIADPKEATSDLAVRAAQAALEMADVPPTKVNLIIVATSLPDHLFPATACLVQDKLGADHAAAFDLSAGCSGFVYALVVADRFIRSGAYRFVLVIGAETPSRILDWKDKGTCAFFGDGAGAVLLAARQQLGGLRSFALGADGSGGNLLIQPAGGTRQPLSQEVLDRGLHYGRMDGQALFRYGLRAMDRAAREALHNAGLTLADIDLIIPHQSNLQLLQQIGHKLKVPQEKVFVNVAHYANISAAAIPVAFCDAVEADRLHPGDRVLLTTFGGGLTWAGAVWQWSEPYPEKPVPRWKRLWHILWNTQAAIKSWFYRLEHRLDTLRPEEDLLKKKKDS